MGRFLALLMGATFGGGLWLSGMLNPAKIMNFLDLAGTFDPSLIFVMGGGIPVAAAGYWYMQRRTVPVIFRDIQVPLRAAIDRNLVLGALIFGVGWGIGGLCPGPALASIVIAPTTIGLFIVAMAAGSLAYSRWHG